MAPMQWAVIHLASEISPIPRASPALPEVVPIGTDVPIPAAATDIGGGGVLEVQHPDDSPNLVRSPYASTLDLCLPTFCHVRTNVR